MKNPQQRQRPSLTFGILIVSTSVTYGHTKDETAPKLKELLESQENASWKMVQYYVVMDTVAPIQRQIMEWADSDDAPNLILTSGGTGFTTSDVTPEAVEPLLEKKAPGLVHGMLAASLKVTPFAMMSRPVAGVRKKSIIVTLPGSPKGAFENLEAIMCVLPHGCAQAAGGDSRQMHSGGTQLLEVEAGLTNPTLTPSENHTPLPSGGAQQLETEAGLAKPTQTPSESHTPLPPGGAQQLEAEAGLAKPAQAPSESHTPSHSCVHGHQKPVRHTQPATNDPSLGPSARHRQSQFDMVSVQEALDLIYENIPPPKIQKIELSYENVSKLVGVVIAKPVYAQENVPAFRASIVDGYALIVPPDGVVRGVYPVAGVSHAGSGDVPPLKPGEISRITTGAPLPPNTNCVIMVEDTQIRRTTENGLEELEVEIFAEKVSPGQNIREVGSDVAAGSLILDKGDRITSTGGELGLLASVGVSSITIYARPSVGILSTGDELVEIDHEEELLLGQVRDSNQLSLASIISSWGYRAEAEGILNDEYGRSELESNFRSIINRYDVIITTGGVSMGETDIMKPLIQRTLGGTIHFGRVNMKPGKPTTFSTVVVKNWKGERGVTKLIFSLPGNPASAIVAAHIFVLPALQAMARVAEPRGLPRIPVVLTQDLPLDSRPEFHRASVLFGDDGVLRAQSTGGQRSSRVGSMKSANALLYLPRGEGMIKKGETVDALMIKAWNGI